LLGICSRITFRQVFNTRERERKRRREIDGRGKKGKEKEIQGRKTREKN
jgi:hypothetical protein